MVRIDTVVIHATDARRAAEFWGGALGYTPRSEGSLTLVPVDGDGPAVNLDETDQMHLDLRVSDAAEQQAEDELHMCFPQEQCYEVVSGRSAPPTASKPHVAADPWYATLWQSVQRADAQPTK